MSEVVSQGCMIFGLQREGAHMHRSFQLPQQGAGEKAKAQLLVANPGSISWYLPPKLNVVTSPAKWSPSGRVGLKKSWILGCVGFAWQSAGRPRPPRDVLGFRAPGALSHHPANHKRCYSTATQKTSFIQSTKGTTGLWSHPTEARRGGIPFT